MEYFYDANDNRTKMVNGKKTTRYKYNKNNELFSYAPKERQWWVTGFNPYQQNVSARQLEAAFTVNFKVHKGMYSAFRKKWKGDKRWSFQNNKETAQFLF